MVGGVKADIPADLAAEGQNRSPGGLTTAPALQINPRVHDRFHRCNEHRQINGQASCHHCIDCNFLYRGKSHHRRNFGNDVIRRKIGAPHHFLHRFPRWQLNGRAVGPAIGIKQVRQLVGGTSEGFCCKLLTRRHRMQLFLRQRQGQSVDQLADECFGARPHVFLCLGKVRAPENIQHLRLEGNPPQAGYAAGFDPAQSRRIGPGHHCHHRGLALLLHIRGIVAQKQRRRGHCAVKSQHAVHLRKPCVKLRFYCTVFCNVGGFGGVAKIGEFRRRELGANVLFHHLQHKGGNIHKIPEHTNGFAVQGIQPWAKTKQPGLVYLRPGA